MWRGRQGQLGRTRVDACLIYRGIRLARSEREPKGQGETDPE